MAILANTYGVNDAGASQQDIMDNILHVQAGLMALAAKLDNDGGITDTDYEARVQQVYVSGGVPLVAKNTFASIVAEFRV